MFICVAGAAYLYKFICVAGAAYLYKFICGVCLSVCVCMNVALKNTVPYGLLISDVQCSPLIGLNTGLSHASGTGTHLYETVINLQCDKGMYINNHDHDTDSIDIECGVSTTDVTQGRWSTDVDDIECTGKTTKDFYNICTY